jgi:hypothetical protein
MVKLGFPAKSCFLDVGETNIDKMSIWPNDAAPATLAESDILDKTVQKINLLIIF